jgi:WhiB family redox-sensing transcriptional regulator
MKTTWPRLPRTRAADQSWRHHAACRGAGPDLFAPGGSDPAAAGAAKAVCHRCPVTADCLAAALRGGEHGVWGGTTYDERRALVRAAGNRGLAAEHALRAEETRQEA